MDTRKSRLPRRRPSSSTPRSQFEKLRRRLERLMVGEETVLDRLLACLLVNGAMLLEGRPGFGEQRVAKGVAEAIGARFASIDLTPDLAPSDLTSAFHALGSERKPADAAAADAATPSVLLVREIDNGPRKIQSLLLEAGEDGKAAIDGRLLRLPPVFLLVATQNTADRHGPYPLSAEQRDRFLVHALVDWMEEDMERALLRMLRTSAARQLRDSAAGDRRQLVPDALRAARAEVAAIAVESTAEKRIVSLIGATRSPQRHCSDVGRWIEAGIGLRGTIDLDRAARAHAWLTGRAAVTPDDVCAVAPDVLRHRVALTAAARNEQITPDDVIKMLLDCVETEARLS